MVDASVRGEVTVASDRLLVWLGTEEFVLMPASRMHAGAGSQPDFAALTPLGARSVVDAALESKVDFLRGFVLDHDLSGGAPMDQMTDDHLRTLLHAAIDTGRLVAMRRQALAGESDDTKTRQAQVRLVQDLNREARGPLVLDGNIFQLLARSIRPSGAATNSFQVVPAREAQAVLERMSQRPGTSPRLRALFQLAAAQLAGRTAPPFTPDGLVLLRRSSQPSFVADSVEPPVTPSMAQRLAPPPPEVLNDFLARFVDELGKPVSGLGVLFDLPSGPTPKTTGGDGMVRANDVPSDFASAVLADLDATRALLKPRWDQVRGPATCRAAEEVLVWRVGDEGDDIDLELQPDKLRTVSLQPFVVQARLFGGFFDTSKSFVLPNGVEAVRGLVTFQQQHSDALLLLVGHTDTAGKPSYNDPLSLERAKAMSAYLTGAVDDWMAWYGSGVADEKRWGKREDLAMIDTLPDAAERDVTENPIRWFQRTRGLDVDGIAGDQTRRALITEYMALDGTSLPSGVEIVTHGCGENFPVDETGDGVADQDNRRVEVFFFDGKLGVQPPPPGDNSAAGSPQYPDWVARAGDPVDFTTADQQVELVIEWPEELVDALDEDASVVLTGDGVAPQKHLLGMAERTEGVVRVSFGELGPEQTVTLTAKQGDRELALFQDQLIGDLDDPLNWDHELLELLVPVTVDDQDLTASEDMPDDGTVDPVEESV